MCFILAKGIAPPAWCLYCGSSATVLSCPSAGPCRGNRVLHLVSGGNCASRGLTPHQRKSLICCMKHFIQHRFAQPVPLAMVFVLVVPSHHCKCLFLIFVPAFVYLLAMLFSLVFPHLLPSHALTHTLTSDCVPSRYSWLGTSSSPGRASTCLYFVPVYHNPNLSTFILLMHSQY